MTQNPSTTSGGPPPLQMQGRKAPRWVVPFLRALERTGEARAAAEDAAIRVTAEADGEEQERVCPHCRQPMYLWFERDERYYAADEE